MFNRSERIERQSRRIRAELRARFLRSDHFAHESEHERFRYTHDRKLVFDVAGAVDTPTGAHDANAEQLARHTGERRIYLRIVPVVVRLETQMGVGNQPLDRLRFG